MADFQVSSDLLGIYLEDARSHLECLDHCLLTLEREGLDHLLNRVGELIIHRTKLDQMGRELARRPPDQSNNLGRRDGARRG